MGRSLTHTSHSSSSVSTIRMIYGLSLGACEPANSAFLLTSCSTYSTISARRDATVCSGSWNDSRPSSFSIIGPGSNGLQVVVGQLIMGRNATFNIDYRSYVLSGRPAVRLVE